MIESLVGRIANGVVELLESSQEIELPVYRVRVPRPALGVSAPYHAVAPVFVEDNAVPSNESEPVVTISILHVFPAPRVVLGEGEPGPEEELERVDRALMADESLQVTTGEALTEGIVRLAAVDLEVDQVEDLGAIRRDVDYRTRIDRQTRRRT